MPVDGCHPTLRPLRRFGASPVAGRSYVERHGAYAVVRRGREVLLTEWEGQLHLPGGGIEADEGALPALHRECLEETGWRIRVARRLGSFERYTFAPDLGCWLRKVCHVHLAFPTLRVGEPGMPGHRALWMPIEAAAARVASDGDRAFLRALAGARGRAP